MLLKNRLSEDKEEQKRTRRKVRYLGFKIFDYFTDFSENDFENLRAKEYVPISDNSKTDKAENSRTKKLTDKKVDKNLQKISLAPVIATNTMKHLLTILFFFISLFLSAQTERNQKAIDTVDVTYSIYELFSDLRLEEESIELKINFDSITKAEFENYKENYRLNNDTVSKAILNKENYFSIRAADTIFEFPSITGRTHNYRGFYPKLNSHLVSVAGEGVCEMFLIDETNAFGLALPNFYDGNCNQPMISRDNRFLMTYGTCPEGEGCFNYYEHISTILIIELKHVNSITELKNFRSIGINEFAIEDVFWAENNSIVLKVFDEITFDKNGQDYQKNIRYIKGTIEW